MILSDVVIVVAVVAEAFTFKITEDVDTLLGAKVGGVEPLVEV